MGERNIGFIGLGSLGSVIAANLQEKGQLHYIYNRTPEKIFPFAERGAIACASIKEIARSCDILFSIVSDDAAAMAITEGPGGIAANLKKEGIHVCMSTILPAISISLNQAHRRHDNHYIACPVIGRPEAAKARQLNLCVAGDLTAKHRIAPILADAGAAHVWDYGEEPENANVAKLCCNFMIISSIETMAEGLALAERSSVDKSMVMKMLSQTIFNCLVFNNYGKMIVEEKFFPAGFALRLGLKDVGLIRQQSENVGLSMPFADILQERLENCIGDGLSEYDWAAIALDAAK